MSIIGAMKRLAVKLFYPEKDAAKKYYRRFRNHAFSNSRCKNEHQYEALITKLYHAIEKGLSYLDYRPGFGQKNIEQLIENLEQYSQKYDVSAFFYQSALCTLEEYIRKNKEFGHEDADLEAKIRSLKGTANTHGGTLEFEPYEPGAGAFDFEKFVKSRHSLRHFSSDPVAIDRVKEAVALAQHTPSACNRQGWKTRVICNSDLIQIILKNQNGNRGFGDEISVLLIVTGDLRYFSQPREAHQVFIDGGMYAMNLLHSLHYKGLASIPLSASLHETQDSNVRNAVGMDDAEVLIMFIGVGNYPEKCITTKSFRKPCEITLLE